MLILILLLAAAVFDARTGQVPKTISYAIIITGLLHQFFAFNIIGFALALLFFASYFARFFGGADAKIFMGLSLLFNERTIIVLLGAIVLSAFFIMMKTLSTKAIKQDALLFLRSPLSLTISAFILLQNTMASLLVFFQFVLVSLSWKRLKKALCANKHASISFVPFVLVSVSIVTYLNPVSF